MLRAVVVDVVGRVRVVVSLPLVEEEWYVRVVLTPKWSDKET